MDKEMCLSLALSTQTQIIYHSYSMIKKLKRAVPRGLEHLPCPMVEFNIKLESVKVTIIKHLIHREPKAR